MKELEENTIDQIRTLLNYLEQTDLLKNKNILMIAIFNVIKQLITNEGIRRKYYRTNKNSS